MSEIIQRGIWIALDAVLGWDFDYPTAYLRSLDGDYLGNIRAVDGVQDGYAIVDTVRRGFITALETRNPEAIVELLTRFWHENPSYRPLHTGRCYPHGHQEVKDLEDVQTCQIDTLTRVFRSWLDLVQ